MMINRQLLIIQCHDNLRWDANLVGQAVPYCGDTGTEYISLHPDGYSNFVQYNDAMIIG